MREGIPGGFITIIYDVICFYDYITEIFYDYITEYCLCSQKIFSMTITWTRMQTLRLMK